VREAPAAYVTRACVGAEPGWLALRAALWPEVAMAEHRAEAAAIVAAPALGVALVVEVGGHVVGFAEASLRVDYVNGTQTTPVGFLEGLYVDRDHWRRGIARALVAGVEDWARARGCRELASDARVDNSAGISAHRALGFEETERVVYFRKELGR
jgi:aminoglycoside 6'-N-acetyltransferase I